MEREFLLTFHAECQKSQAEMLGCFIVFTIYAIVLSEIIFPSESSTIRLHFSATVLSCVTITMVFPIELSDFITSIISSVVALSSAAVGSSAMIIFGWFTSARARATRCFCL